MRVALIGVPGGQRTEACTGSLRSAGHRVDVLDWRTLATDRGRVRELAERSEVLRIESPSDDPGLDADLVRRGGGHTEVAAAELVDGFAWWRGLGHYLQALDEAVQGTGVLRLHHCESVLTMFDKAETRARLRRAAVPVADGLDGTPDDLASLRRAAEERGWSAVFAKARFGSSGAGLLALRWAGERLAGYTTVGFRPNAGATAGWSVVNVPVRRVTDRTELDAVYAAIRGGAETTFHSHGSRPPGAVIERWVPKFGFENGVVDLRVVVIAGQARQVLARVGPGPITNLHLGARRGDVDSLAACLGPRLGEALRTAEAAAECFPRAHHAGVDVGLDRRGRPFVLELNAFGDFHAGITDAEGLDTYAAELQLARA